MFVVLGEMVDHAALQGRLRTAICLDESIRHAHDAAAAIRLGACRIINIKPGRVGGLLEAKRVHDVAREHDVPVWIDLTPPFVVAPDGTMEVPQGAGIGVEPLDDALEECTTRVGAAEVEKL